MSNYKFITPIILVILLLQEGDLAHAKTVEEEKNQTENADVGKAGAAVTNIELLGVKGALKKNIEARLPAFKPMCGADSKALQSYQRSVLKKIEKASRALGYYHSSTSFVIERVRGCWLIKAQINKGLPITVAKQTIRITGEGSSDSEFMGLPLPYKIGAPLNHLKYSDFKSDLIEIGQEKGFLAAKFLEKEILVDLKRNTASVTLHFDTGKRFRYGDIHVEQSVLDERYINRYILLKEGDYFSSTGLIEQQQLLQNSGYYSSISVQADYKNAKQATIPVNIILTETKRNHYRLKLGFGTDTGFRTRASLDRRWTGSSGRKLNIALGLSQRINEITTQLVVPKDDPAKNNLVYSAGIKREENDDVRSESVKIGATLTSLQDNDWRRSVSLTHLSDKTRVEGESDNRSSLTLLGLQYSKVQADNRIFPKKGWRLRLEAEGAIDKLLSDASVLQFRAHAKYIKKLDHGRLLLRTDWGTTFGDSLDNLPKDLRFFAGGINSIRGYGYESLGELNDEGRVIGGKSLLEASIEYEYPVFEKWSIAAFVDAGNAFDDSSTSEIKVGVGTGVRWSSPIGPVRLDFGVPEDNLSDLHLHLSIGPDL